MPGGPKKRASSRLVMNCPVASSKSSFRFIFLLKSKSKLSKDLSTSRKRACFIRRATGGIRLAADATSRPLLLAGLEGIFYGRFWVITEGIWRLRVANCWRRARISKAQAQSGLPPERRRTHKSRSRKSMCRG